VFDAVRVWKDEELLGRRHCAPTAADDSADNQNVCAKYYHSMYRLVEDEILRVTIVIKCFPIYAASVIKAIFFVLLSNELPVHFQGVAANRRCGGKCQRVSYEGWESSPSVVGYECQVNSHWIALLQGNCRIVLHNRWTLVPEKVSVTSQLAINYSRLL
jgi:hypothetical protein